MELLCLHAASCGGCPIADVPYGEQLTRKRLRVVDALAAYPALAPATVAATLAAEPAVGYRTRAKLMVGPSGSIGLFARHGDHVVVDAPECLVLAPVLARAANAIRGLLAAPPAEAAGVLSPASAPGGGALVAIDLREVVTDDVAGVLVTLVLASEEAPSGLALAAASRAIRAALPEARGVAANLRSRSATQVLGAETRVIDGATSARDTIGGVWHLATYGSFVQAHRGQAAAVHRRVAGAIAADGGQLAGKRVLDLYGGSGALSLALVARGAEVTLVEVFAPAAEQARAAAAEQRLGKLDVLVGDAATVAEGLTGARGRFDAVVVNPPRRGLSARARIAVAELGAPRVAYVSCDPQTLARDLDHFARLGLTAREVQPVDMIPLTDEVESVAMLEAGPPLDPRVVYADDEVIVVDKPPHEPTTPQGEWSRSLLDGVRRLTPEATPVHRLDAGTSGLVVFARRPGLVAPWAAALAGGRKVYLALVRGTTLGKGSISRDLRDARGSVKAARTRYRRLAIVGGHSLLRVSPDEGRTHQIRRHFASIGHPVLGDERHGHAPSNRHFEEKHGLDRTFLHCVRVELTHPTTGAPLVLEAPLPGDLATVLARVGGADALASLAARGALGGARPRDGADDAD